MYPKTYTISDPLLPTPFPHASGILSPTKPRVVIRHVERWRGRGMESTWCLSLGKVERNDVENFSSARLEVKYTSLMKPLFNEGC